MHNSELQNQTIVGELLHYS